MIYFDVTKMGAAKHRSGLMRVSGRLRDELGTAASEVVWRERAWHHASDGAAVRVGLKADDWVLTAELFCEAERPGLWDFLREKPCRLAAIFNDAIPISHPHITWPQSVARHPEYMKMLAAFDRVFAISRTSAEVLTEFWDWQGVERRAAVETILLGADFLKRGRPDLGRAKGIATGAVPSLLTVGILEPRKNQAFLLEVCEALWSEGLDFELNVVGRVNPHFGKPVAARIAALRKRGRCVTHHEGVGDDVLLNLYRDARATVFPTIAEGCGLPVLESLWLGVPCVCSDLPVLRENADGGGCVAVAMNDKAAWVDALRRVLTDDAWVAELRGEAGRRVLPTWARTAEALRAGLER
jgi:glycosyltransferase involved in cell wall biosynthesis